MSCIDSDDRDRKGIAWACFAARAKFQLSIRSWLFSTVKSTLSRVDKACCRWYRSSVDSSLRVQQRAVPFGCFEFRIDASRLESKARCTSTPLITSISNLRESNRNLRRFSNRRISVNTARRMCQSKWETHLGVLFPSDGSPDVSVARLHVFLFGPHFSAFSRLCSIRRPNARS